MPNKHKLMQVFFQMIQLMRIIKVSAFHYVVNEHRAKWS